MARPTRRQTKHRGNAAGMIEARGRTGRKPRPNEKGSSSSSSRSRSGSGSGSRSSNRSSRYDKPPTWRGSAVRAVIAAALVYGVSTLLLKQKSAATNLILLPIVLALYMPLIYYTDRYMYRRAQRKRSGG
jgi:hypothetical protein